METLPENLTREGARKDLEEIQQACNTFGVRLFVTYGALLGLVRDHDFIEYDDDIDLVIIDPMTFEQRKRMGHLFSAIGYTQQGICFRVYDEMEIAEQGYNGDSHSGIIVMQKRIRTTLFFFGREECPVHGHCYVCRPKMGSPRLISTPAHFFDNPQTIQYKGKTYLTPGPQKDYLTYMYGDDWKKPIKGKHAPKWWEDHPGLPNEPRVLGGLL